MASSLGEVLGRMTRVRGIIAAILMKVDGSITELSVSEGVAPGPVRAFARDLLSRWEWVGSGMGIGRPQALVSATTRGPLCLMPVGPDAVLLALGDGSCRVGRIRYELRQAGDAVRMAQRAVPGTIPNLRRMISEMTSTNGNGADEIVRTIERATDQRPATATAGEVVVTGVNSFHLAMKLVTALSHVKGVRSARLKTYAPGSITIGVDFERGGALASITGASFGDCPLEITERTDVRLVLRIPNPVARSAAMVGRVP
jgi:predicted regulator of Ras-like GTPase activity (Roadblock/LC7/MglB family)